MQTSRSLFRFGFLIYGLGVLVVFGDVSQIFMHGNPLFERQIEKCRLKTPEREEIRLYEGNGGATTAYWYKLTLKKGILYSEKEFVFFYGVPVVKTIVCRPSALRVIFDDGEGGKGEFQDFAPEEINKQNNPIAESFGKILLPARWRFYPSWLVLLIFELPALAALGKILGKLFFK